MTVEPEIRSLWPVPQRDFTGVAICWVARPLPDSAAGRGLVAAAEK